MKKFITLLLPALLSISSFSQYKQPFNRPSDSIMQVRMQSHYYQDTLWVMDSVLQYHTIDSIGLMLRNTLKILSRNNLGNELTSLDEYNGDFPGSRQNHIFDSIIYFNGTDKKQSYKKVWIPVLNEWKIEKFKSYEEPNLLIEDMEKLLSASLQQFTWGYRYIFENVEGKKVVELIESYVKQTNSWKSVTKNEYLYDEFDNDTLKLTYRWKNNMWVDSLKQRNFYLGDKVYQQYSYTMNAEDSTWHNLEARFLEYSSSGLNTQIYKQTWDEEMTSWVDFYKVIMTYDNEDRLVNSLYLEYNSDSQHLENSMNSIFYYEENKKVNTYQDWDASMGVWQNYSQYLKSYLKDDLIDTLQGNDWNDETQQWQGYYREISRYDDHFNKIDMTYYSSSINDWIIAWRYDFFWSPFFPDAINEITTNGLTIYPNPASNQVTFALEDILPKQDQEFSINIFSISGQKITEIPLKEDKVVWDCSNLEAGLYIYSVDNKESRYTGKIVLK